ncbi:MAG: hypothetical protein ACREJU_17820 [Nitrospiraceae bacterium]
MNDLAGWAIGFTLLVPLITTCAKSERHHTGQETAHRHDGEGDLDHQHAETAVASMASGHPHVGPHFKRTTLRPRNAPDQERAEQIAHALRESVAKYKDSREAVKDGFEPFLPHLEQARYHFTKKWHAFKGAFRFDPTEPTSLLYKKTADGYELIGAMYTAPKRMSEEKLNERVPLSVAQWHAHVNICLPAKREMAAADWTRFGFKGSIATEDECDLAGGRWYPQIYGWMLHVYPFERAPDKIWTH